MPMSYQDAIRLLRRVYEADEELIFPLAQEAIGLPVEVFLDTEGLAIPAKNLQRRADCLGEHHPVSRGDERPVAIIVEKFPFRRRAPTQGEQARPLRSRWRARAARCAISAAGDLAVHRGR